MFNNILFIATILITRIALPIGLTFIVGSLLKRALHRDPMAECAGAGGA